MFRYLLAIAFAMPITSHAVTRGDISQIAGEAFKEVALDPSFKGAQLEPPDGMSYDITVKYSNGINASRDTSALLHAFIRELVRYGMDPSAKESVNVCAEQIGLTTPTGKAGVILMGCSHYNPFTEAVTFNPAN